jgi:thiol-disulfide isomerase/thioredoxin
MTKNTSARRQRAARREAARHRQLLIWAVTGIVAGAAVTGLLVIALHSSSNGGAHTSTSASGFALPALQGSTRVRLATFNGEPTVVNMFASWCTQCEAELPEFHRVATALRGKVHFVFVNSNETGDGAAMARRHNLFAFPVARDVGGNLSNGLYRNLGGTGGMPMTAFYDTHGRLLNVARGALLGHDLDQAIKQLYGIAT